jgi:two-component system invasion response regulator UvrY
VTTVEPPPDETSFPEPVVDVLVVDDSDTFRELLREVVLATPGMACVGEAASGEAALAEVERLAPAMVVMDKRMPGLGGIEAARQLSAGHPEIVVVLVSVEEPEQALLDRSRAAAFLHKQKLNSRVLRELWEEHKS